MKINAITPFIQKNTNLNTNIQDKPQSKQEAKNYKSIYTDNNAKLSPLSFTGGYSINLAETIKGLDKLTLKHPDIYPPNIREWAMMVLEEGNSAKHTLISLHKKLYEGLEECASLKSLKERFPEFKNVLSVDEVDVSKGSFIEDFKNGNLEFFNPEEDLTLQLIKLYWGQGFSLNDIKNLYAGGKNIDGVMNKLNIPKVNRHYGHVLKISDPEYNERLMKQIQLKRMEALDAKAQKESGEPVYIKRGHQSQEHKDHISEGLKRYWQEHPERIIHMSEVQKEFYRNNPDRAERFHKVLELAWGLKQATPIKKSLSGYLKRHHVEMDSSLLSTPEKMNEAQSKLMARFWGENEWAKKSFSKVMKYSWKKVKIDEPVSYPLEIMPKGFKRKFYNWLKQNGYNLNDYTMENLRYYPTNEELVDIDRIKRVNQLTPKFIDAISGDESSKMANTFQRSLLKFARELKTQKLDPESEICAKIVRAIIRNTLIDDKTVPGMALTRVMNANDIETVYITIIKLLMSENQKALLKRLYEIKDKQYDILNTSWKPGQVIEINPDKLDF